MQLIKLTPDEPSDHERNHFFQVQNGTGAMIALNLGETTMTLRVFAPGNGNLAAIFDVPPLLQPDRCEYTVEEMAALLWRVIRDGTI
ncbi:MAG: hypothetical protein Q8S00_32330 [Deltaproteobacteria bacterium]|nr:hypothetical protein [Deltaproteobacteria bacterium]